MLRLLDLRFGVVAVGIVTLAALFLFEANRAGSGDERQLRLELDAELATAKAFLQIRQFRPTWLYDRSDPEQTSAVERIRNGVFIVIDARQTVLERSQAVQRISLTRLPEEGVWFHLTDENGTRYLLRKAVISDQAQHAYFLVIGKPIADDGLTRLYWLVGTSALLLCGLIAWAMRPFARQELTS